MSDMEARREQIERLVREVGCTDSDCSCEEFAEHLFELLDAEMPEEQARRLDAHAADCVHCTELTEAEKHLRELLREACCGQAAPDSLRTRIVEQFSLVAKDDSSRLAYSRTEFRSS